MKKYIDRQTVKEYLNRAIFGASQKIDDWVDTMPAADVAPVVRGTWETMMVDHPLWYCSKCNQVTAFRTPYCPYCGAYMREERDDG